METVAYLIQAQTEAMATQAKVTAITAKTAINCYYSKGLLIVTRS